LNTNF